MDSPLRSFVGIPVPETVTASLAALQRSVEDGAPGFYRWSEPDEFHLTLYFLGETPEPQLSGLIKRLQDVKVEAFQLELGEPVILPERAVPRVLAGGLVGDVGALSRLQQVVRDICYPVADYKEMRAFRPHITFGRLKRDKPGTAKVVKRTLAGLADPDPAPFTVSEFTVYLSHNDRTPRYEALARIPLSLA